MARQSARGGMVTGQIDTCINSNAFHPVELKLGIGVIGSDYEIQV